jgi:hypothetical protein
MDARTRRKLEAGRRSLGHSRAHPDGSAGYIAALHRLEERLARADALAGQQLNGIRAVRSATARKRELRRQIESTHIPHLITVGRIAAREVPELAGKFTTPATDGSYVAFRTAARTLAAEAVNAKDVLIGYGLVESVLDGLNAALARFDQAVEEGTEGRRAHVGASAELRVLADEIVELIKAIGAVNRLRFANDAEVLAAWESASSVVTVNPAPRPPAPGTQAA